MGKSPVTVSGKVLKNRENRVRLAAAGRGLRLVKLRREGVYMLMLPGGRGGTWAPAGSARISHKMTLDEAAAAVVTGGRAHAQDSGPPRAPDGNPRRAASCPAAGNQTRPGRPQ